MRITERLATAVALVPSFLVGVNADAPICIVPHLGHTAKSGRSGGSSYLVILSTCRMRPLLSNPLHAILEGYRTR